MWAVSSRSVTSQSLYTVSMHFGHAAKKFPKRVNPIRRLIVRRSRKSVGKNFDDG
jgi:hypothetical protein